MAEYLSPGVYVEETTFRAKSIEGVATSTTGYAGMTRYGPVHYTDGPRSSEPRLITSFTEFERVYGGLEPLKFGRGDGTGSSEPYLAHAARMFFLNGGKRLYVSRVYLPKAGTTGVARSTVNFPGDKAVWHARWPGEFGKVLVRVRPHRKRNVAALINGAIAATGLGRGAIVEVVAPGPPLRRDDENLVPADLRIIDVDASGVQRFLPAAPHPGDVIREVTLRVDVITDTGRTDSYLELACHPAQRRWIGRVLQADDPEDENAVVYLETDDPAEEDASLTRALELMRRLETRVTDGALTGTRLTDGDDGELPPADALAGKEASADDSEDKATGLWALGEIDDIAIVAVPDGGAYSDPMQAAAAAQAVIAHAELMRYRIAVVDAPQGSSMNEIRSFRGKFDTKYAALYHPWVEIFDPLERPAQGGPPRRILLPPSGFVTGIYARSDIERGVFKAPANEVVRGLTRFEANINTARQDVLNPEGINALRFFEGRGSRVWGARTMSSDPEWRYVNVRRFFIFLEHSIDKAMQWAVFEPNNPRLWTTIRRTVEDFLFAQWQSGALLGNKPEEAYFVACDRTTMTQLDLDSGRLVCLIGVSPTRPAEFVIFRIGQWTAESNQH